ncbi:hypothetical protein EGI15_02025 [Chryseobacterium cucumeris]|uniref:Uncharacterized protein n=1 Tax=Chryseobacterium cucumeris TaxID=1813611 RepID=A0ABX9XBF9_9FLAO|nr:hypothetical protein EGI15_02025 [Chryseobacterium cucumeris]
MKVFYKTIYFLKIRIQSQLIGSGFLWRGEKMIALQLSTIFSQNIKRCFSLLITIVKINNGISITKKFQPEETRFIPLFSCC